MQSSTIIHAAAVLVAPALVVLLHTPARADVPRCQGLAATVDGVVGTAGDDVIVGSNLSEDLQGLGGDDVICGRGGSDLLMGGDGNDRLYGQRGRDLLDGGSGDDVMRAGIGPSGTSVPIPVTTSGPPGRTRST